MIKLVIYKINGKVEIKEVKKVEVKIENSGVKISARII